MKRQMRWLIVLITLLALASLACSTLLGGDEETGSVNEPGSPVSSETGEGAPDAGAPAEPEGPQSLDMLGITSGLADASSYRLRMDMRLESPDANGVLQTANVSMETATVADPPAFQSDFRIAGDEALGGTLDLQILQVGDATYTTLPEIGCISGTAAEMGADINPFANILESGEVVGDVSGARRVLPDENINGIESYHFVFDETAITDPNNGLEEVDGHIFVAKEDGHLVRLVMDGVDNFDLFDLGLAGSSNVHIEVNVTDVDQPVVIVAPENCTSLDFGDFEIPDFGFESPESP